MDRTSRAVDFTNPRMPVDTKPDPVVRREPYAGPFAEYVLPEEARQPVSFTSVSGRKVLQPGRRYKLGTKDPAVLNLLASGHIIPAPPRVEPTSTVDPKSRAYADHPQVAPLLERADTLAKQAEKEEQAAASAKTAGEKAHRVLSSLKTARVLDEATDAEVEAAQTELDGHRASAAEALEEAAALRNAEVLVRHRAQAARDNVRASVKDRLSTEAAAVQEETEAVAKQVRALTARAKRLAAEAARLPPVVDAADLSRTLPEPEDPSVTLVCIHVAGSPLSSWVEQFTAAVDELAVQAP